LGVTSLFPLSTDEMGKRYRSKLHSTERRRTGMAADTWTMREAFHAVSPCRTTTTSVDNSSPAAAPAPGAGVGDMALGWCSWRPLQAGLDPTFHLMPAGCGADGRFQEAAGGLLVDRCLWTERKTGREGLIRAPTQGAYSLSYSGYVTVLVLLTTTKLQPSQCLAFLQAE
jgi:hypothetical protein